MANLSMGPSDIRPLYQGTENTERDKSELERAATEFIDVQARITRTRIDIDEHNARVSQLQDELNALIEVSNKLAAIIREQVSTGVERPEPLRTESITSRGY